MSEAHLPRDHEGREIPLDTLVLYDAKGEEMYVSSYRYQCDVLGLSTGWNVISEDAVGQCWQHPADSLYLNRPDSWEKLEEDLSRGADAELCAPCYYVFRGKSHCKRCRLRGSVDDSCSRRALADILDRIRKLRGAVEKDRSEK